MVLQRSSGEAGWATTDPAAHTIQQWSPGVITRTLTETLLRWTSKNDRGDMQVDRKLYHLVEDLKVDRGDGEPWDLPIPTMPEHSTHSPGASPRKRARDDVINAAFSSAKPEEAEMQRHYFIAVQNSFLVPPLVVITALPLHSPLQCILSKIVVL
ncbi:hypothetical protein C8F04DRAFT_1193027 [Mycena alexandri]|uniref:Uncharacterized protein n=1 Tax=Mycena alexandri TaxID=1745969 RepID=A0AAD6WWN2_9AGAR|nr:hypothetical protein C8F04DRAFT_1193027 [Mycena alexandri]